MSSNRSLAAVLPDPVRSLLGSARDYRRLGGVMSIGSFTNYRRVVDPQAGDAHVEIRLRSLGGQGVRVRPGTADRWALQDTFSTGTSYHLPPPAVTEPRLIWDLGANVGLTMVHFAHLYPAARIVGVELDAGNTKLCRQNVAPWGDRCEVVEGGVWTSEGVLSYRVDSGEEQGCRVEAVADKPTNAEAPAISLNGLLERSPGDTVDYVKMDIEGAERSVLRENTEWAASVRAMKVEVHEPYSVGDCVEDLTRLGFDAVVDDTHFAAVTAARTA